MNRGSVASVAGSSSASIVAVQGRAKWTRVEERRCGGTGRRIWCRRTQADEMRREVKEDAATEPYLLQRWHCLAMRTRTRAGGFYVDPTRGGAAIGGSRTRTVYEGTGVSAAAFGPVKVQRARKRSDIPRRGRSRSERRGKGFRGRIHKRSVRELSEGMDLHLFRLLFVSLPASRWTAGSSEVGAFVATILADDPFRVRCRVRRGCPGRGSLSRSARLRSVEDARALDLNAVGLQSRSAQWPFVFGIVWSVYNERQIRLESCELLETE